MELSWRIRNDWLMWLWVHVQSEALRPLAKEWLQQIPMGRLAEVSDLQASPSHLAEKRK